MNERRSMGGIVLAMLLVLTLPRLGHGQPVGLSSALREHLERAQSLNTAGQFAESLRELDAAYALVPNPRLQCSRANTLVSMERFSDALSAYGECKKTTDLDPAELLQIEEGIDRSHKGLDQMARQAKPRQDPPPAVAAPTAAKVMPPLPDGVLPGVAPAGAGPAASSISWVSPIRRPLYKKWWFWGTVGTVVAGGVVAGVVLGIRYSGPCGGVSVSYCSGLINQ